nr:MAG TPA: hypothetical protein [Caudoviricetes sp.]
MSIKIFQIVLANFIFTHFTINNIYTMLRRSM